MVSEAVSEGGSTDGAVGESSRGSGKSGKFSMRLLLYRGQFSAGEQIRISPSRRMGLTVISS